MKLSMHLPVGVVNTSEFQSFAAIFEMAVALENAGVDACYVTDHPAPSAEWLHANGHDALDPFVALSFVAAATKNLHLHTNILVLPYRNPFLTAKAAATLQVLSEGRLILGVGGGYQKAEFDALGVDFSKRGAIFDESLEVLDMAWSGGPVVKHGLSFDAVGNEPRPVPEPRPSIWIGGGSDKAVSRAARWGDGWCPFFAAPNQSKINQKTAVQSIDDLREKINRLREMLEEQGRGGPFDVCIGPRAVPGYGARDGAERYIEILSGIKDAGATWTTIEPPHPSRSGYIENIGWFQEEVFSKI